MTAGETRETVQREVPNGDMTLCGNWAGMRTVSLDRRHLMQRTIRKGICAGAFFALCVNSSPSAAAPSPCSHLPSRSLLQILSTVLSSPYIRKQSSQAVPTPGACSTNASRKNTEKNSLPSSRPSKSYPLRSCCILGFSIVVSGRGCACGSADGNPSVKYDIAHTGQTSGNS